eukprot:m.186435 g.186435  ORF g.186435 m.186435 type:complete len:53 (-) comp15052_c2_seq1:73-231(-)
MGGEGGILGTQESGKVKRSERVEEEQVRPVSYAVVAAVLICILAWAVPRFLS